MSTHERDLHIYFCLQMVFSPRLSANHSVPYYYVKMCPESVIDQPTSNELPATSILSDVILSCIIPPYLEPSPKVSQKVIWRKSTRREEIMVLAMILELLLTYKSKVLTL